MNTNNIRTGFRLKLSKDSYINLNKGRNLVFYKDVFPQAKSSPFKNTIIFTVHYNPNGSAILRSFSKFPLVLKTNFSSITYMNDSIISITQIESTKILLLLEQSTDEFFFESYQIEENDKKGKLDFLDNIIEYFEKDKTYSYIGNDKKHQKDKESIQIEKESNEIDKESDEVDKESMEIEKEEEKPKKSPSVPPRNYYNSISVKTYEKIILKKIKIGEITTYKLIDNDIEPKVNKIPTEPKKEEISSINPEKKVLNISNENYNSKNTFLNRKRKKTRTISEVSNSPFKSKKDELDTQKVEKKCTICLDKIKQLSQLDTCKHEFCKECIDKWAKVSSQCPLCKENFTKILYFNKKSVNTSEKKITQKHFVPDEEEYEQWFLNCDDKCLICGKADNSQVLLVCDMCDFRICHTYCVGLDVIPDGDWFCPECVKKLKKSKKKMKFRKLAKKLKNTEANIDYPVDIIKKKKTKTPKIRISLRKRNSKEEFKGVERKSSKQDKKIKRECSSGSIKRQNSSRSKNNENELKYSFREKRGSNLISYTKL